jgi:hypothetical protein
LLHPSESAVSFLFWLTTKQEPKYHSSPWCVRGGSVSDAATLSSIMVYPWGKCLLCGYCVTYQRDSAVIPCCWCCKRQCLVYQPSRNSGTLSESRGATVLASLQGYKLIWPAHAIGLLLPRTPIEERALYAEPYKPSQSLSATIYPNQHGSFPPALH